jgi:hypothetical protein
MKHYQITSLNDMEHSNTSAIAILKPFSLVQSCVHTFLSVFFNDYVSGWSYVVSMLCKNKYR